MRSCRIIQVVSAHAEGEVGDVITGGVAPPPGESLWEQREFLEHDQELRQFLLNEPRGGVFRHVNLLVPPKHPDADAAFLIMEPEDNPPMSGSNAMCVATVVLDTGLVAMQEPLTHLTLEAPGGLVPIVAECRDGKARRITVQNLPSFAQRLDAMLEVEGLGTLTVDTAFGGDSFVMVAAESLGLAICEDEARDIASLGVRITRAANEQLGFTHPLLADWSHISFCGIVSPVIDGCTRSAVTIQPGKVDRSPTGTGVSARMALLARRGQMARGDRLRVRSIIGGEFIGEIADTLNLGDTPAIVPRISGRAWITGFHQHLLDPDDPWPGGYRLSDTWGVR